MAMALRDGSIAQLNAAFDRGTLSVVEATQACLDRIDATEELAAFLSVDRTGALAAARRAEARRQKRCRRGPLDGVPLGLKDNLLARGLPATCGSKMLADFWATYDATVVARLRQSGAIILGKLAMDEFGMGSSGEQCAWGSTRNPWCRDRVPGGSSSGPAAAVASRTVWGALATDTGGSVRQPAAFTGLVGIKPTYGRVSRFGLVAFGSSLEQIGPLTRTVSDAALLLQTIAGADPRDATCSRAPVPSYTAGLDDGVRGLRLGVIRAPPVPDLDPAVATVVDQAVDTYRDLGAVIEEVSLPHAHLATACYYVLCAAEASSNLARYDGVQLGQRSETAVPLQQMATESRGRGLGEEVRRRILWGAFVLSAGYADDYLGQAQKVRTLIQRDYRAVFQTVDLLISATTPTPAFRLGEKRHDPIAMYQSDALTVGANLAGLPAIALPGALSAELLPIGFQLTGPAWSEPLLLTAGRAFERTRPEWSGPPFP